MDGWMDGRKHGRAYACNDVCMCGRIHIRMHVGTYKYICMYKHVYIYTCIHAYTYVCSHLVYNNVIVCQCFDAYIHTYSLFVIHTYIHIYIPISLFTYLFTSLFVHMYIHTHTRILGRRREARSESSATFDSQPAALKPQAQALGRQGGLGFVVRVQGLGFRFRVARSVNAASLGQVFGFRVKGLGFEIGD